MASASAFLRLFAQRRYNFNSDELVVYEKFHYDERCAMFTPPLRPSVWRAHNVLNLSVRPSVRPSVRLSVRLFVCYQAREHDILNMNEPFLIPIGTSGSQGKDMKW